MSQLESNLKRSEKVCSGKQPPKRIKRFLWGIIVFLILLGTIFHESLYVRLMSLGDTYGYQSTPELSVLEYVSKERSRLGEDYYPVTENIEVKKVEITPDQHFLFYIDYEDNAIAGLAICARRDLLNNWYVSDSMRNGTFSTWRGETCRTTLAGEDSCTKNPYTKAEIEAYITEQMAKVSHAQMENRCRFRDYTHDPEWASFQESKRKQKGLIDDNKDRSINN